MTTNPSNTDNKSLVELVGPAHPTISACNPQTNLVYPIYSEIPVLVKDNKGREMNIAPSNFYFIKANEIFGPFSDIFVARDTCQYKIDMDIEHGIVNP